MVDEKTFLRHLNDAYALENQIVETLERHLKDAKDVPDVAQAIQGHIDVTKKQAETVKGCIEQLRGDVSGMKSNMASMMGAAQGMMPDVHGEALLTNAKAEYTTEHFEMACYTALIAMSNALGHADVSEKLQQIMNEEVEMANWLIKNIPVIATKYTGGTDDK